MRDSHAPMIERTIIHYYVMETRPINPPVLRGRRPMTSRVQGDEEGPNSWTPVFWSGLTLTRDSASAPPRPVWPGRQSGSSGSLRRFILGDKQELRDTSNSNRDHDLTPMDLRGATFARRRCSSRLPQAHRVRGVNARRIQLRYQPVMKKRVHA
jgi:hypothetical protein